MGWKDTIQKPTETKSGGWKNTIQAPADESAGGYTSPSENLQAALDTVKSLLPDGNTLAAFGSSVSRNTPVIGPAAARLGAEVESLVNPKMTVEQSLANQEAEYEKLKDSNPVASALGGIGAAVTNPLTRLAGWAGIGANAVTSSADMAARSGLANEKINSLVDTGSDVTNAAENLLIESILGKGADMLGGFNAANLRGKAKETIVKDSFRPSTVKLAKDIGKDDLGKLGAAAETLLDQGLVKPGQTRRDLLQEVLAAKKGSGERLNSFLDANATLNRDQLAQMLSAQADSANAISKTDVADAFTKQAQKVGELPQAELPLENLRNLRSEADAGAKWGQTAAAKQNKEVANYLRDAEEQLVPDASRAGYKDEKTLWHNLEQANDSLKRSAAQEFKGSSGPIQGWKDALLKPLSPVLDRAPQFKAWGYNLGAKVAENNRWVQTLAKAGERGGQAGVASAHYLMMQRDPEYRQAYSSDNTEK